MHHVCAYVCALVCHTDLSKTTTARDFLLVNSPMNFHALENSVGFVDLSLKISNSNFSYFK